MGVGYFLVNETKKELIRFTGLPVNTIHEIAGNPVSAALVTWYLYINSGDDIGFVSDTYEDWPFHRGKKSDLQQYRDFSLDFLERLIGEKILEGELPLKLDESGLLPVKLCWMD